MDSSINGKKITRKLLSVSVAISVLTLSGCQTMGMSKQQLGSGLGAVAGVLVGSQIGDGSGRKWAMALGGLAGAYIGGVIGQHLDEQDRLAATQALEHLGDRQSTTYSNPQTGKQTTFTVNNTRQVEKEVPIVRYKSVQAAPAMELIGKPYVALKSSNVRNAPTTQGSVVLSGLQPGETFTAVGKVKNKPWIMVAQNDISVGYVHTSLVAEASTSQGGKKIALREAVDLDTMESNVNNNYTAVNLDEEVIVENSVVSTSCRNMTYSQSNVEESFNACKGADGAWEIDS
jgi:surface antigen